MALTKEQSRKRIHHRIRKKINGTAEKPRLAVYRSNKAIYLFEAVNVLEDLILPANKTHKLAQIKE